MQKHALKSGLFFLLVVVALSALAMVSTANESSVNKGGDAISAKPICPDACRATAGGDTGTLPCADACRGNNGVGTLPCKLVEPLTRGDGTIGSLPCCLCSDPTVGTLP